jgi:Protein of unknown function (DUF4242)
MKADQTAEVRSYLVESYRPGITEADAFASGLRAKQAVEESSRAGREIRYVALYLVTEDEATLCVFEASSSSIVAETCRQAELPFDRIVAIVPIGQKEISKPAVNEGL